MAKRWMMIVLPVLALGIGLPLYDWFQGGHYRVVVHVVDQYGRPIPDLKLNVTPTRDSLLWSRELFPTVLTDSEGRAVYDSGGVRLDKVWVTHGCQCKTALDCYVSTFSDGGVMIHDRGDKWHYLSNPGVIGWVPFTSGDEIRIRLEHTRSPQSLIEIQMG